jgi:hypothetical protein
MLLETYCLSAAGRQGWQRIVAMSDSGETLSYDEAKAVLDGILSRSAQDPEFRKLCLADGREAVRVAVGQEMPEGVSVHFVDNPGQGAGIVLPPLAVDAAVLFGSKPPAAQSPVATTAPAEADGEAETKAAKKPRGLNIRPKQD